jgi:DNA-binding response OmpR family regulator
VEDEPAIADVERRYLSREGFGVHVEADGEVALGAIRRLHPVAVLLDVGLPGLDGTEVCRRMRAADDWTPVLFVTARDDQVERIVGLELGADDYIVKPFSPPELVARLKAVLRRGPASGPSVLRLNGIALDSLRRRVTVGDGVLELTATEFDLLAYLMARPGQVFTRDQLLSAVWGYESAAGTRTVDVHISQLRAKLGDRDAIRTVRGVGYSIEP